MPVYKLLEVELEVELELELESNSMFRDSHNNNI
jgi:hypothetical protein